MNVWKASVPNAYVTMAMTKGSPYRPFLSKAILKMKVSGIIHNAIRRTMPHQLSCKNNNGQGNSLSVKKLALLFFIPSLGIGLAIIILVSEIWTGKSAIERKRVQQKDRLRTVLEMDPEFYKAYMNLHRSFKALSSDKQEKLGHLPVRTLIVTSQLNTNRAV